MWLPVGVGWRAGSPPTFNCPASLHRCLPAKYHCVCVSFPPNRYRVLRMEVIGRFWHLGERLSGTVILGHGVPVPQVLVGGDRPAFLPGSQRWAMAQTQPRSQKAWGALTWRPNLLGVARVCVLRPKGPPGCGEETRS